MALYRTDWLVGSYESMSAQAVTIDGSAQVIPAGSYYLYDAINDLSLLAKVKAAMTAAGVADPKAELLVNRRVRLSSSGVFSFDWGGGNLRTLLGYTINLAGSSSYSAPLLSPLLWSPGTPGRSMMTRRGVSGHPQPLVYQSVSSYTGRTEQVSHGTRYYNRFEWANININRMITTSGLGGEFATWFTQVAVTASRFKLYQEAYESALEADTSPMTTLTTALGPYIYTGDRKGLNWLFDRSRGKDYTDERLDLPMNVHVCPEYDY